MVAYIQNTNRNSFSLRNRKYKNLCRDIWGRITLANKKNKITNILTTFAQRDLRNRIQHLSSEAKKKIYGAIKGQYRPPMFEYQVKRQTVHRLRKPYKFRMSLRVLGRAFRYFYQFRNTRKSLRKIFAASPVHYKNVTSPSNSYKRNFLERRADVLLYRANFAQDIRKARLLIKYKHFHYLIPKQKKIKIFITHKLVTRPYTQIPIFSFFKLTPTLAAKRKTLLHHMLRSGNKLFSLNPKWLYVNYNLMVALLIKNPIIVRYTFVNSKSLATFIGAARYF